MFVVQRVVQTDNKVLAVYPSICVITVWLVERIPNTLLVNLQLVSLCITPQRSEHGCPSQIFIYNPDVYSRGFYSKCYFLCHILLKMLTV